MVNILASKAKSRRYIKIGSNESKKMGILRKENV